jgi:hypothetical protein
LDETPYGNSRLGPSALRTFLSGSGEALPLQALVIRFEGVIRVEGWLLRWVYSFNAFVYPFTLYAAYLHEKIISSSRQGTHHLSSAYPGLSPMNLTCTMIGVMATRVGHLAIIVTTSSGLSTRMVSRAYITHPFSHFNYRFSCCFEYLVASWYGRRILDHLRRSRLSCSTNGEPWS